MSVAILMIIGIVGIMIWVSWLVWNGVELELQRHATREYMARPPKYYHLSQEDWEEVHYGRKLPEGKFINIRGHIIEVGDDG